MSHFDQGKLVGPWRIEPVRVFGGYRLERLRWHRTAEGWDQDSDPDFPRSRVYASEAEAREAISRAAVPGAGRQAQP